MTVPVNTGHRLGPSWVSCTEGPLTRRTKAQKQNKQFSELSIDVTQKNLNHISHETLYSVKKIFGQDQYDIIPVSADTTLYN